MVPVDYGSVSSLKQFLKTRGLSLQKGFGQNFLITPGVREKIYHYLSIEDGDTIWEIGPGIGAMTVLFLQHAASVKIFEIDYGFITVLREFFGENPNCTIIPGDFMETGIASLKTGDVPDIITGNLPYNAGSAMIYRIAEIGQLPKRLVFTLQREVVHRMKARPGKKDYSLFSVVCRFVFEVEDLGEIAPGAFYPAPEVVSKIVRLTPHGRDREVRNRPLFFQVAKALFAARRKTINNNFKISGLQSRFSKQAVLDAAETADLDLSKRGETIPVEQIKQFTNALDERGEGNVSGGNL